ncbi:MAG: hypothetical protein H3C34_27880, partial [Caldilineaceae bacterium]|nr:hypothetical protein [Caldilineaceae bacterium]
MLWSIKNHGATLDVALRRGGLLLVVAMALTVAGAANVRAQSKAAPPAGSE